MEVRGSLKEASSSHVLAYGASNQTTLTAHASSTTHTLTLPQLTGADTIVSRASTDTLTNKTLTSPKLTSGGGGNLVLAASSVSVDRTLTLQLNDSSRTVDLGGDLTTAGALTTSGAFALTLTATAATNVTLPTTGTLATLAGAETLTGKTLVVADNTVTTAASGNLAATELNAALAELQTDVDTRALDSDLTTHEADTSTHGVAGDIVGTTDAQTLTNKTLTAPVISTISNTGTLTLPSSTDTLVGRATADILTNKTLVAADNTITTEATGTLAATELNAALAELANEKLAKNSGSAASLTIIDGVLNGPVADDLFIGNNLPTNYAIWLGPDDSNAGTKFRGPLQLKEIDTPNINADAGSRKLYLKSDGNLYSLDSSGTETAVLGAGAGEKNYIAGSSTASGWTASGAGITVATDTTAGDLPRPNTTATGIKFTGVSGSTAYAYYRFILDDADAGKKLKVQFDMKPVSGYTASDFKVDVYSNTASDYTTGNARLSLSTDSSAVSALPNLTGTYRTTFDAPAVSAKWIEVRIGMNATHTHSLVLSDVVVGPGVVVQGYAGGPATSYTPGTSLSNATLSSALYERRGESARISISWDYTGNAGLSFTPAQVLPPGMTLNESSMAGTARVAVGTFVYNDSGSAIYDGAVYYRKDLDQFLINLSITPASPDSASLDIVVPIAEWAGSGTVNIAQNDVMYASNDGSGGTTAGSSYTTGSVTGPLGSRFASVASTTAGSHTRYKVSFPQPVNPAQIRIEISEDAGTTWTLGGSVTQIGRLFQSTSEYGMWIEPNDATSVYVCFGNKGRVSDNGTYAGNGSAWSDISGSANYRYRVAAGIAGQAVGFSEVQPGISSGLVSASGLKGNTGATVATGYVGEYASWGTVQSGTGGFSYAHALGGGGSWASNSVNQLASDTLNKGTYLLCLNGSIASSSTGNSIDIQVFIGGTNITPNYYYVGGALGSVQASLVQPITITADSTTVAIKARNTGAAITALVYGSVSYVRIA